MCVIPAKSNSQLGAIAKVPVQVLRERGSVYAQLVGTQLAAALMLAQGHALANVAPLVAQHRDPLLQITVANGRILRARRVRIGR